MQYYAVRFPKENGENSSYYLRIEGEEGVAAFNAVEGARFFADNFSQLLVMGGVSGEYEIINYDEVPEAHRIPASVLLEREQKIQRLQDEEAKEMQEFVIIAGDVSAPHNLMGWFVELPEDYFGTENEEYHGHVAGVHGGMYHVMNELMLARVKSAILIRHDEDDFELIWAEFLSGMLMSSTNACHEAFTEVLERVRDNEPDIGLVFEKPSNVANV